MPGWAGSQATREGWKCFLCLQENNASRDAVTQVMGTMVCLEHASWLPINVYRPKEKKSA